MARHTIPEYQVTFEQATGIPNVDILVYDEGNYERIGIWQQELELLQIPDVNELSDLALHIPPSLHCSQEDFPKRSRILAQLQGSPKLCERILQELTHIKEEMRQVLLPDDEDPMSIARLTRGRMEEIIWDATPLLLKQLERAIIGKK